MTTSVDTLRWDVMCTRHANGQLGAPFIAYKWKSASGTTQDTELDVASFKAWLAAEGIVGRRLLKKSFALLQRILHAAELTAHQAFALRMRWL